MKIFKAHKNYKVIKRLTKFFYELDSHIVHAIYEKWSELLEMLHFVGEIL